MNQDPRRFLAELQRLRADLLVMGDVAEERLRCAIDGLVRRDVGQLAEVIVGDSRVDALQMGIERQCFTFLALHQPVATDLRTVVSTLKMSSDLERVADLAVEIGRAGQRYLGHPAVKPLVDIPRMANLALKMLREALDAFVSNAVQLAHGVLRQDEWLDGLREQVFREVVSFMISRPQTVEPGIDLIYIARHLERVGDHATNIAEDVIFVVEGRDVRHRSTSWSPGQRDRRRPTSPPDV